MNALTILLACAAAAAFSAGLWWVGCAALGVASLDLFGDDEDETEDME